MKWPEPNFGWLTQIFSAQEGGDESCVEFSEGFFRKDKSTKISSKQDLYFYINFMG